MIAVALRLVAKEDKRDELLARVKEGLLGPTRAEPGCIKYRFYQDVENPNAFSFVEQWESWDAVYDHFRSEPVGRFLEVLESLIAEAPDMALYEVAETRGLEAVEEARSAMRS